MNGRTKTQLANLLAQHLSEFELISLALSLNVDYENLEGKSKNAKALDLVVYMDRRGRSNELLDQIQRERPDLAKEIEDIRKEIEELRKMIRETDTKKIPAWIVILVSILLILILVLVGWQIWGQDGNSVSQESSLFQVRVQDDATSDNIENAKVTLDLPGTIPLSAFTDSVGLAAFEIESQYFGELVGLHVEKSGFESWDQNIVLEDGQRPYEVRLKQ